MRSNQPVSTPADGTIYVVSVSGDKFADQALRDYAEVGFAETSDLPDDRDRRHRESPDLSRLERLGRSRRPPRDLQASAPGTSLAHPDLVRSDRPGPR